MAKRADLNSHDHEPPTVVELVSDWFGNEPFVFRDIDEAIAALAEVWPETARAIRWFGTGKWGLRWHHGTGDEPWVVFEGDPEFDEAGWYRHPNWELVFEEREATAEEIQEFNLRKKSAKKAKGGR